MILIILTQFFGLYYVINEFNIFHPHDWYWVSQFLAFICIIINTVIIIFHRKDFESREFIFLLSYSVLPMAALVMQNIVTGAVASIDVATMLTLLIFYIGIQSEQSKQLKMKEVELATARIDVMLSQIQPHFLYNSLTAIQELCYLDPDTAGRAVGEFSMYLRGNLNSLAINHMILFEKELAHVQKYLSLEKMRFGSKLNISYDISVRDFKLPVLTLQPIVENAVRHGVTKREEGGTVAISTAETENSYLIKVVDDGVGFNPKERKQDNRSHIGIENVRSRLGVMSNACLSICSEPGIGTTAIINIPK